MNLKNAYIQLLDFHKTFQPWSIPDGPTMLDERRVSERYKFMLEELDEFVEAEDLLNQADAMIDLIYFAIGTLVEMGVEPQELFNIVHEANMAKIWNDGEVHYNSDRKVMKPEDWQDPEPKLLEAIGRQLDRAKWLTIGMKVKGSHYVGGK